MKNNLQVEFVDSNEGLVQAVGDMVASEFVAIDTEFMRERTYYPELCLIQVATNDKAWCLDALAIEDLSPFLSFSASPALVKVLHSARQDLEIFYQLMATVPVPVFDTQLAAAMLGCGEQISYAGLVEKLLGKQLDKSQVRTDWSARPLSSAQIEYAVNDVAYLGALRDKLSEALSRQGRMDWFLEDSNRLGETEIYTVEPEQAWRKVKGVGNLSVDAFRRLALLAAWREGVAQRKNLPRAWILKDPALLAIAEHASVPLCDLQNQGLFSAKQLRRWGDEISAALDSPSGHFEIPPFLGAGGLDAEQKRLFKGISQRVKQIAQELELSPSVLANRKEMEKVARGVTDSPMFCGWRASVVGAPVKALLAEGAG